jgi:hypothetical protein
MHGAAWQGLLKHIPPERHNQLSVTTTGGVEIAVQTFLRIDPECVAIKGRLAGSQDAGRVFFVPYAKIEILAFQQQVKEEEFHELFGGLTLPSPAVAIATDALTIPVEPEPPPAVADGPAEPITPSASSENNSAGDPLGAGRSPTMIKSVVLERYRARSGSPGAPSGS